MFELAGAAVRLGGRSVLAGLDLRICEGEQVAIIGPSGAGKTTLLRLLAAGLPAAAGRVRVLGQEPACLRPPELRLLRSRIGFVPQDFGLVPNLRVWRNVVSGRLGQRGLLGALRSHLWPSRRDLLEIHELLERAGIEERMYHRTDTLSGGQQQRVALVRALFQRPRALLADEPVASVDPARARDLLGLLDRLAREEGLTLVVSLHDLELAREFPRVVGLRSGRIEFDEPAEQVDPERLRSLYRLEDGGGAA